MKKQQWMALLAFAAALVVVAGGLYASNMGFKLNYPLLGPGAPATGTNTLSLPFNRQAGINNVKALGDDVGGFQALNGGPVLNIQKLDTLTNSFQAYSGVVGEAAFPLATGEGSFINVNTAVDYIVAGSHHDQPDRHRRSCLHAALRRRQPLRVSVSQHGQRREGPGRRARWLLRAE